MIAIGRELLTGYVPCRRAMQKNVVTSLSTGNRDKQNFSSRTSWTMRQKRAKAYRKLMNLYSISFGFRQPYQVLGSVISYTHKQTSPTHKNHPVDSEICKSAVTQKLDLQKQLYSVLQGEVKPSGSLTSSHFPETFDYSNGKAAL